MNIYYVYHYLREKDSDTALAGTPYYVGKGKDRRAYYKSKKEISKPTNPNCIVVIAQNLTEAKAFELEKAEITRWGRKDLGTGILRNQTDGGEGSSGRKYTAEYCTKLSETSKRYNDSLSKEEKTKRSRKAHDAWMAMSTPEQRSDIGRKNSDKRTAEQKRECARKMWEGLSKEERTERAKRANAKQWDNMSEERKAARAQKISTALKNRWAKMSPEERSEFGRKTASSYPKEKRRENTRAHWNKLTDEQKNKATEKARAACSSERKREIACNRWAKMSPEERSEAAKRAAATRLKRQQERKQKEIT